MTKNLFFQDMRGIAIIAVVFIHATSTGLDFRYIDFFQYAYTLILRQLIDFPVALFFFLAGYFINQRKVVNNSKIYLTNRLSRIAIPFLIWSFVGLVAHKFYGYNIKEILFNILTGQTGGIYYFLIVLIQLILITPIILRIMEKSKFNIYLMFLLSPLTLLVYYIINLYYFELSFPLNALFFPIWFIFYILGIYFSKYYEVLKPKVLAKKSEIFSIYIFSIILSVIECFILNFTYSLEQLSVSQIKLSSYLMSISLIILIMARSYSDYKSNTLLRVLGDNSFGIYLIHMYFMYIIRGIMYSHTSFYYFQPVYQLLVVFFSIAFSLIFILCVRKVFGKNIATYLGF